MKLDILAFGAHPDDVELCAAGTLMKHIDLGYKVGVIDLTQGELGTRGTAETRELEAIKAAKIMGISIRENLGLPDGFFQNDPDAQLQVIMAIRKYQPTIVFANAIRDRHPDHGRASELVRQAAFYSGLRKIQTELDGKPQEAWRPKAVYHFIQDHWIDPDLVVDITDYYERKKEAYMAYETQFYREGEEADEPKTPISGPEFQDYLMARMRATGRLISVEYGEGFTVDRAVGVGDMVALL